VLDHIGLNVSDYGRSRDFYAAALAPLGLELLMEPVADVGGFGSPSDRKPFFWISTRDAANAAVHVAFAVDSHDLVDGFYAAAMEAGATDNGEPGPREVYHPNYYGAYVLDPDGNNIEAVCHLPQG
jgi:catechol 2,3-dioxygenase-like lactoylglutathione lyase family enzyme